ncbi:MAG TPA: hypothetical protein VMU40_08700 [Steroidobacteraceae bacterium]|nr:hypothetical protein [Steroidobacteraceae bacterium]
MFWTRAVASGEITLEHIKRNFGVVEAPDHVIYLASLLNILSSGLGFKASADRNAPVLGDGQPIPMMSYSLVEYLHGIDLCAVELLELGGGSSTRFWASRVKSVLTLETSQEWLLSVQSQRLPNVEARLSTPESLSGDAVRLGRTFDGIVIDSAANRLELAGRAVAMLRPGGFVILDNSDWYPNAARVLRESDLIQIDFHDFRPLHSFRCTTSLFLHREFRAKPRGTRLPLAPIGGKDVADTNRWDRT